MTQPTKIGRYEVIERVGRGGMGAVYLGRDTVLEREVAIKVMSADFAADETSRPRFYREARAAAKLQHRNIVTIFEFGEEDDTPFIVMEFLRGQDLAKRMRAEPPLTLEQKIDIIAELCTGLHFAHEQGVIHRDVKPANIWLVPDGSVKLLDFGIAKFSSSTMTRQGSVLGSISYMPPEQINGLEVDGRADVFAAGVVLFELLTGRKPFAGESPTAVLARIMDDEPVRGQDLPADLPKPLVAAVLKALQKDREKRYRHAADFGADLRLVRSAVVASTGSISTDLDQLETMVTDPSRSGTIDSSSHQLAGSISVQRTATLDEPSGPAPAPRRRGWLVPVVAVAVIAGAVGGWLLLGALSSPQKTVVTITSDPAGAKVALDGIDTARVTPTTVDVQPGAATLPSVTLTSPAHKPVTARLTPDDVKKGSLLLRMEALPPPPKPQPPVQAPAATPSAQPPPDVVTRVAMSGEYPFEVLDGTRVLSASSTSHSFTVKGKPRLRIRNAEYFLDQPVQTDGSRAFEWTVPGLGKLFMTVPPLCTVAIAGRTFADSPIDETMAAGTYAAEVTCDGQTRRQTFSIAAGQTSKVPVEEMNDVMKKAGIRLVAMAVGLVLTTGAALAGAQDPATEGAARRRYESGLTFLAEKKYSEALKDFQAVVELYQQSRVADAALLRIAEYQLDIVGDVAAAQTAIDLLQKRYGNSESGPMGLVLAGRIILAKSRAAADVDSAIASYDRVPRLFPGSDAVPASMFFAGEALRLTHRDAEAVLRFRQVSTDYPESEWAPRALLSEARCLVLTGKAPRAMELLQRVRQRFPKTSEAETALAWNTILYRLYLRVPAQPAFQHVAERTIAGAAGRLKDILALAIGPGGTLYAAHSDGVLAFDLAGRAAQGIGAKDARAISFDRSGNPTVVSREGIVGPDGAPRALAVPKADGSPRTLGDIPAGVLTSNGDLLVADSNAKNIARFSGAGKFVAPFAPVFPFRLAIDVTDRVVSLDESGAGLTVIEHDGRPRATIPARAQGYEFDRPVDLAVDALGHIYVLDRNKATVFVFAQGPQPRLLTAFTVPPKSPGVFRKAVCFALDSAGRLYIYDDDVEKIQVYQ